jgi:hypothetical protein
MNNVKAITMPAMIQALQLRGFVYVADLIAAGKRIQERKV